MRYGVVGVGHLGSVHARLLKGIETVELVGVYDIDQGRVRETSAQLDVHGFESYDEMLDVCDVVSIVTPTSDHARSAGKAIDHGVHVFIEKPLAATYAEASDLLRRARERGLRLGVGHIERFNPVFNALDDIAIRPLFIESHRLAQFQPRATDVAVVLDLMIHDIDLVLALTGSSVTEVRSSGVSVVSSELDIANARIEFASGCVANLTASRISQRPMRKMRIFQQDAYLSIDFAAPSVEIFRIADSREGAGIPPGGVEGTTLLGQIERGARKREIYYTRPEIPGANALENELRDFVSSIQEGRDPRVTGVSAAEALRLAEQVIGQIEASDLGRHA